VHTEHADIDAQLRALLAERVRLAHANTVDSGASLLDLGLDSTGILSLVVGIEERFDLEIPDREITVENFGSVGSITRYVAAKRRA
jgi:acyl carrier protein